MEFALVQTDDGCIEVRLHGYFPILQDVFRDGIESRPPRGAPQDGLSTYWIDTALANLRARILDGEAADIAHGNVAYLRLSDGFVEARYEFDNEDVDIVDRISPQDLVRILETYRDGVVTASPGAAQRVPLERSDAIPLGPS